MNCKSRGMFLYRWHWWMGWRFTASSLIKYDVCLMCFFILQLQTNIINFTNTIDLWGRQKKRDMKFDRTGDEDILLPDCQRMVHEDIEQQLLRIDERVFLEQFHIVDRPVHRTCVSLRRHLHLVVDRLLNIYQAKPMCLLS